MRVALEKKWIDQLVRLPESGMGDQRVDVCFVDGRWARDVVVLNAEEADLPDDLVRLPIREITPHKG